MLVSNQYPKVVIFHKLHLHFEQRFNFFICIRVAQKQTGGLGMAHVENVLKLTRAQVPRDTVNFPQDPERNANTKSMSAPTLKCIKASPAVKISQS